MSFLLPYLGMGVGLDRMAHAHDAGNEFGEGRAATGTALAAGRALTTGAPAGSAMAGASGAMAGAGAGIGMAAGVSDSLRVLGHGPSAGVEEGMTGVLGLAGGIQGAARPDSAAMMGAGGVASSFLGMEAADLDREGNHALAAGAAIGSMGAAGAGAGGAIGEDIAGPAGAAVGAALGGAVGLGTGSIMEIAQDDAPDERIASINEDHGITGGEGMAILGAAGTGALIGSVIPAVGTAVGAGVGALAGGAAALIGALWD
jgi:hypothetical protein